MKCCMNCEKRMAGCHSTCEMYIAESRADHERKEKIRVAKEKERANQNYIREHYRRNRRHG